MFLLMSKMTIFTVVEPTSIPTFNIFSIYLLRILINYKKFNKKKQLN